MLRRVLIGLAVAALALAGTSVAEAGSSLLKLERVVALMRHGVRPPLRTPPLPDGYLAFGYPSFPVDVGLLTPHGAEGVRRLGRYDRADLARRGLLTAEGCPPAGSIMLWADVHERTQKSAEAWAEAFAPGCAIPVGHETDTANLLFDPTSAKLHPPDPALAREAAIAQAGPGGLQGAADRRRDLIARIGALYGCCRAPLCPDNAAHCRLEDLPADPGSRPGAMQGGGSELALAAGGAGLLLLEYAEGMPMAEVGWGRASPRDIEAFDAMDALQFDIGQRNPYMAPRRASALLRRMLADLESPAGQGPAVSILLGHDSNVAPLGGLLGLHWHAPGYAPDSPALGGALGFERLSAPDGQVYVRAYYRAQTLDQLRSLVELGPAQRPYRQDLPIPGCDDGPEQTCPLPAFRRLVERKLAGIS